MNYSIALHSKSVEHVAACLIAYTLWSLWSDRYLIEATYPFKISIETCKNQTIQEAPHVINVRLRGLRRSLRSLDSKQCTIHIPGQSLKNGTQLLTLKREYCLIPERIRIIDYSPLNCSIKVVTQTTESS